MFLYSAHLPLTGASMSHGSNRPIRMECAEDFGGKRPLSTSRRWEEQGESREGGREAIGREGGRRQGGREHKDRGFIATELVTTSFKNKWIVQQQRRFANSQSENVHD